MISGAILISFLVLAAAPAFAQTRGAGVAATATPVLIVNGGTSGALAGRSTALADIDGDGRADLIVGAPSDSTNGALSGQVMIFFGGAYKARPDRTVNGSAGERFGWSVADAGDVDGNGVDDLIVGAPFNDTAGADAGAAYVFFGWKERTAIPSFAYRANVTLTGEASGAGFGYAVAGAGDVNLDAFDDVAVGAPLSGSGRAYVFYGGAAMDTTPDRTFSGGAAGDAFGYSVAGGSNVDGDTSLDLAVGAPMSDSGTGSAVVVLNVRRASLKSQTLTGAGVGDHFGASVAMLDFNGDGFADVAVGAPLNTAAGASAGRAYLYFGSSTSSKFDPTADRVFSGASGEEFGWSVAAGDPRTDALGDLIVGAPLNDTGGKDAGAVYVFYGNATADTTADVVALGAAAGSEFGFSLGSGMNRTADFNGDRSADFVVGAPLNGTANRGAAYLYLGFLVIVPANPTVFGYVLDNKTGTGLVNALVTIESSSLSRAFRTIANGSYGIGSTITLPPAAYWINASMPTYFPRTQQRNLAVDTRTNVSFRLPRLPVIHGTVFDGNTTGNLSSSNGHSGLPGATVQLLNRTGTVLAATTTNAGGSYFFRVSDLGSITVKATRANYFDNQTTVVLLEDQNLTRNLNLEKKPFVAFHASDGGLPLPNGLAGARVQVQIGGSIVASGTTDANGNAGFYVDGTGLGFTNATKSGYVARSDSRALAWNRTYSISLTLDRLPTLSGTVRDALTGTALRGATVDALFHGNKTLLATMATDNRGIYAFGPLLVDAFDVRVTATGYMRTTQTIALTPNDVATLDFAIVPDAIPPASQVASPPSATVETAAEFTVTATATDPNGNEIQQVDLFYSYNNTAFVKWASDPTAPYAFTFNASRAQGDGRYGFYTIATDYAGNVETAPATNDSWVFVDAKLPVSRVQSLPAYETGPAFAIATTASDVFGVREVELWYSKDGGAYAKYASDTTAPYEWTFNTSALGDGLYAFYSIAIDLLAQSEPTPAAPDATTRVDTTPPSITIDSPADGSYVNATPVSVHGSASDGGSQLATIEMMVDAGSFTTVAQDINAATYDLTQSLSLSEGAHSVSVRATDRAGLQRTVTSSFTLDSTAPSLTITSPSAGAFVNRSAIRVTWSASDSGAGLEKIEVRVDGGTWLALTASATDYTTADLPDGPHSIDARATDRAGNAFLASVSVRVDATPPTLSITAPSTGSTLTSADVTVSWTGSDAGSGIDHYEIRLDSGSFLSVGSATSYALSGLGGGSHAVTVRAVDAAGNVREETTTFTVNLPFGGLGVVVIGLGSVVVIAVIVLAVWYLRRARRGKPGPPDTEPAAGETPEEKK